VITALRDLQTPAPPIYWTDLLGSAAAGWGAFAIACTADDRFIAGAAAIGAIVLLYRAYLFIHELSHAARRIRGFTTVWNLVAGFPLLVPSVLAVGVHTVHHRSGTYGTADDPEYLPFARSRMQIARFLALSLAFPSLMALRFLVAGPIALLVPPLQRRLERQATSLAMNPAYRRHMSPEEHRTSVVQQAALLLYWSPVLVLPWTQTWPWRGAVVWIVVASGLALINGIRTLASHRYESDGSALTHDAQWADSIDTPGTWWTTIWAPVGHRYHALHHYVPGLPYHNLGTAYRRLAASGARGGVSSSLRASLGRLWSAAGRRSATT
jgi:fatty acid desaturase